MWGTARGPKRCERSHRHADCPGRRGASTAPALLGGRSHREWGVLGAVRAGLGAGGRGPATSPSLVRGPWFGRIPCVLGPVALSPCSVTRPRTPAGGAAVRGALGGERWPAPGVGGALCSQGLRDRAAPAGHAQRGHPSPRPPSHCTPGSGPISVTAGESLGRFGPRPPGCQGSGLFCPHLPAAPYSLSLRPGSTSASRCVLRGPGALHRWGTSVPRAWRPPGPGSRWPHIPLPQSRKCKFLWWGLRPKTKDLKPAAYAVNVVLHRYKCFLVLAP